MNAAILMVFPLLMAYAAFSDLITMTIANWVSLALVAGFVILAVAAGMPIADIFEGHIACGVAVLAMTFAFFAFGWIGGGDAKLAAATAVWLGWTNLFPYGLAASVLGGVLTVGLLTLRKVDLPSLVADRIWAKRLHAANNGVPYGIALAIAGLVVYPDTAIWTTTAMS